MTRIDALLQDAAALKVRFDSLPYLANLASDRTALRNEIIDVCCPSCYLLEDSVCPHFNDGVGCDSCWLEEAEEAE